ncbi:MAG TPA: TPM domain-containing protein [Saprospiraceae bacterium]|nr:TPM domain-containing protein [Saprospiraceae bacterium]
MAKFFSRHDEDRIVAAIQEAECDTSGEIRVHLQTEFAEGAPVLEAASETFHYLKMDETEQRNGVLIFIAPTAHQFAILGDKGINEKVPENFWEDVRNVLQADFRQGKFADGLCKGIAMVGQKLKNFFPYQSNDVNELPDEISYGK